MSTVGWTNNILSWARNQIEANGVVITDYVILRGKSEKGCLIKIQTTSGEFYIKSVGEFMAHEPRLTDMLSKLYPAHFPVSVGIDEGRHWLLMRSVDGMPLAQVSDIMCWAEALRAFARIQIDCTSRIDDLLALGCPDWRLGKLIGEIDKFFALASFLEIEKAIRQKGIELSDLARRLKDLCMQLAGYEIPASISHGDFHFDNIYASAENPVYLDWAEGYLGHPFFVLADFFGYLGHQYPDLNNVDTLFRTAYLTPWTIRAHMDQLTSAFELSRPLAVLRYAISGVQTTLTLSEMTPEIKKKLAKVLASLIPQMHSYAVAADLAAC